MFLIGQAWRKVSHDMNRRNPRCRMMIMGRSRTFTRVPFARATIHRMLARAYAERARCRSAAATACTTARKRFPRPENETPYHFVEALIITMKSTWNRPDFEEVGSGFEVTAYMNDWDQDRI